MRALTLLFYLLTTFSLFAAPVVDDNSNGMDDAWEQLHGVSDPYADEDEDGIDNIFEYLESLDPHINNSDSKDLDNFVDILTLYSGWNLLSIPALLDDDLEVGDLFSSEFHGLWKWDTVMSDYIEADNLKISSKVGYWVFTSTPKVVHIERKLSAPAITKIKYDVGFLGTIVAGYAEQTNDGELGPPEFETNWGYKFTGWIFQIDPDNTDSLKAVAQYKLITYVVTYIAGDLGAITNGEAVQTVGLLNPAIPPVVTPVAGQVFLGWSEVIDEVNETITNTALYGTLGMVTIAEGKNLGSDYSLSVSGFYMDKYEVNKSLWDSVASWASSNGFDIATGDGLAKGNNHPVCFVSWYECVKWCNARSEKEGLTPCYRLNDVVFKTGEDSSVTCNSTVSGYRLPETGEWEYAARGGIKDKDYPWGTNNISTANANYVASTAFDTLPKPYTSPVGIYPANAYGLYDMAGNVWEWTNTSSNRGTYRYLKGGSWSVGTSDLKVGDSGLSSSPKDEYSTRGFRTVRQLVKLK